MCSSSAWLSPTDSAHIKWVVKALNSTVLRCLSSWDESNREASRHACSHRLRPSIAFGGNTREGPGVPRNRKVIEEAARQKYIAGDTETDGSVLIHSGESARLGDSRK
jgi:hypothetical protein